MAVVANRDNEKLKKILFISYCFSFNFICLFPIATNFIYRFFIDGFLFFVIGIILLKINPFKRIGVALIFAPFLLLHIFFAIKNAVDDESYPTLPIVVITLLTFFLVLNVFKKKIREIFIIGFFYIVGLILLTHYLPNYYHFIFDYKNEVVYRKKIPSLLTYNEKGEAIDLSKKRGKVLVIDVWTSSCGICIKEFPKFESLKNQFKGDSSIEFYSLNIYSRGDKKEKLQNITSKYTFRKIYGDENFSKKLGFNSYPQYIIINKNSEIEYIGSLNLEQRDIYNNFYILLNNAQN